LIFFLVVGSILYFVAVYNGLILVSRNIQKAWANIDVLLKQRYDEIPKLIKLCETYMKYERDTLEKVVQARSAYLGAKTVGETAVAENQMSGAMRGLLAVAENYPELKANQNFIQLQNRVSSLESQIADRREFFNDSVNSYNIRINQIPDLFVAQVLGMREKEMFKVADTERQDPGVNINLPQ